MDTELNNTLSYQKKLLTVQHEWTRLNDTLMTEQKWLDEVGVSIPDLTKTSSNNYVQLLSNTQVKKILNTIYLFTYSMKYKCDNI